MLRTAEADGRRRDRERAQLLPRHLPGADPAPVPRDRGGAAGPRDRAASSAWATGSAATATATRSSTPRRWRTALARQSETALRHYLTQVHELGAELSISATLQPVTPRAAAPRRRVGRPQRAPPGRAVPARADRRLRAPGGDAAGADRHRGAAPRGRAARSVSVGERASSPTCARSRRRCRATTPRRWSRRAWRR